MVRFRLVEFKIAGLKSIHLAYTDSSSFYGRRLLLLGCKWQKGYCFQERKSRKRRKYGQSLQVKRRLFVWFMAKRKNDIPTAAQSVAVF